MTTINIPTIIPHRHLDENVDPNSHGRITGVSFYLISRKRS